MVIHPVDILRSKKINIVGVSINKGSIEKKTNEHHFKIKNIKKGGSYPISIELQFAEVNSLNKVHLDFLIEKSTDVNLFFSDDGLFWSCTPIILFERHNGSTHLSIPLTRCAYIQIVISSSKISNEISGSLLKDCSVNFEASSHKDRLWIPENLTDGRDIYGWSSSSGNTGSAEHIMICLKNDHYIHSISMRSTKKGWMYFPKSFAILLSQDKKHWSILVKEGNFSAAPLSWYRWRCKNHRAKYIKIVMTKAIGEKKYEILELGVSALAENEVNTFYEQDGRYPEGSEIISGLVRFSEHNGVHPFRSVQSNDPRLKEATTEYPGIIKVAKDRESTPMAVVQSNDSRLKPAAEEKEGVVRLAKDNEKIANAVIQSNDSRLRLSTTKYPGIVQLAENNSFTPAQAVQANDDRLRNASTTWAGIVQIAKHREVHKDKVLLSDDPRLLEATEEITGRMKFARNKSEKPYTAVQGNDDRLKTATDEKAGLIRLAKAGVKKAGLAVQGNDPRLKDARKALPHEHDYAPKNHTHNSHLGSLNLSFEKEMKKDFIYNLTGLNDFPFSVRNKDGFSAAFQGGIVSEGIHKPAIHSFSKSEVGIKAKSKSNFGAVFFSEKNFSIHLPAQLGKLIGSSQSILAEGDSVFRRNFSFENGISVSVSWPSFSQELFAEGDLLTIEQDLVCKLKSSHQPFIGVYTLNPGFCLSQPDQYAKSIQFAILGITNIRIKGEVKSGDWISYLDDEPGVGRRISQVQKQHGFAVSMVSSRKEAERLIPCLLRR